MTALLDDVTYFDDLLDNIELGRVVPILGPELVTVERAGEQVPLDRYLAQALAAPLGVRPGDAPAEPTLSEVTAAYLSRRGSAPADVPIKLYKLLGATSFAPPEALCKLARIRPLRLFISVTFDSLLRDAIDRVRFGGAAETLVRAYAPNQIEDLPDGWSPAGNGPPLVYHLFGRASPRRNFVLTEEDLLEQLHSLQSEAVTRTRLFDELNEHHLLFIGCRFPDWLARFVLRTTRRDPLSTYRAQLEVVADGSARSDKQLEVFLEQFSARTRVYPGTAAEFVDALSARWLEKHPEDATDAPAARTPASVTPAPSAPTAASVQSTTGAAPAPLPAAASTPRADDGGAAPMRRGSVFISYSSTDRKAAEQLARELSEVDVWLDRQQLAGGADWDGQIRRNIDNCSIFVPLLSRSAAARDEGYFRYEWHLAVDRSQRMDPRRVFLLPVVVDDLPNGDHGVPDQFWARQAVPLPGGVATPEFRTRVRDLVRGYRAAQQR